MMLLRRSPHIVYQDAANGEFASAIETLVTAISLIKQSKVASDDRCKILISSLQVGKISIANCKRVESQSLPKFIPCLPSSWSEFLVWNWTIAARPTEYISVT